MFQQVYFHKAARAAEWMIRAILARAAELIRQGVVLPSMPARNRLHRSSQTGDLGRVPRARRRGPLGCHARVGVVSRSAPSPISPGACAAAHLFKTLELYDFDDAKCRHAFEVARDIAEKQGFAPESYVGLDVAADTPFSDGDDPLTVVFPQGVSRKPGDVSFLLGRLRDETVTRKRLIFAPELRESIRSAVIGMKAPLVVSSILLMSSALALPASAESVHFVDGVYGRFDGDFDLSLSAGAAVVERGPTAAFMGRALYLGTAGPYVAYADSFGDREAVPPRSLSLGIGVRPLWVPRWGLDLERGPAILDLTIDATTFDLGVLWASDAGGHLGKPGFEVALGTEVPLAGQAAGPWSGSSWRPALARIRARVGRGRT